MSIIINQIDIHANDLTINYGIPNPTSFPKGGIYKISQNITLKAIYNATIFYNTDKSSVYNTYTDTILINNSSTLNFYAVYNNIKSQLSTENYTILSPLVATPNEGIYSVPQNITLKAFSDDALIYYSTDNLDIQQYKGSINISSNDTITAFYSYKGVKSENTIFNYTISEFGTEGSLNGRYSGVFLFDITGDQHDMFGYQSYIKISNLNKLQTNFRIASIGTALVQPRFENIGILSTTEEKQTFLTKYMKCLYNKTTPGPIDVNDWSNNFCVAKDIPGVTDGLKGSPCRCSDTTVRDACNAYFPPTTYNSLDNALNVVLEPKTSYLAQSIEGGPLFSPSDTPSITNLPNFIYEGTNNYYDNYINNNYWSFNGDQYNNNSFGLCLLSNKILTLPMGIVFDDNYINNFFGVSTAAFNLFEDINSGENKTWTYFINSSNYKGYTCCYLPSFFELDYKYGFTNSRTLNTSSVIINNDNSFTYSNEINRVPNKEYNNILKISSISYPKGDNIELLRDQQYFNDYMYTKGIGNISNIYTNSFIPHKNQVKLSNANFSNNGILFQNTFNINFKGNSATLQWDNPDQEISEYWKLNDAGDKYIAVDSTEVDPNLVNYEFPKYNLPFNYTKSPDYIEYTKSISVNITDMYDRNIKISYQWVRFIDQITIRKYKDKLLKDNTNEDVDTYLNNLQTKIENLHKENPPESSFYPQTDLKSDQLVKLLDVQLVDPPSEFSYGYVAEVYEMIYSE